MSEEKRQKSKRIYNIIYAGPDEDNARTDDDSDDKNSFSIRCCS